MRCIAQRALFHSVFAAFDLGDFLADGDHGFDEAVQLFFGLGFGRLDHQSAGHREGHGGGVEAEVHQALGDVFLGDAAGFFQGAQVQQAFVCDSAVFALVQNGVVAA